jgi:hypothetical protein
MSDFKPYQEPIEKDISKTMNSSTPADLNTTYIVILLRSHQSKSLLVCPYMDHRSGLKNTSVNTMSPASILHIFYVDS